MKIYLASGNKNKKREMQQLFPDHEIVTPLDVELNLILLKTEQPFTKTVLLRLSLCGR